MAEMATSIAVQLTMNVIMVSCPWSDLARSRVLLDREDPRRLGCLSYTMHPPILAGNRSGKLRTLLLVSFPILQVKIPIVNLAKVQDGSVQSIPTIFPAI